MKNIICTKVLLLVIASSFFFSCKVGKDQNNSFLVGKWKCVSDFEFDDNGRVDYQSTVPCLYDLVFTKEELTFLNLNGENGKRNYLIKEKIIFIQDFEEAFIIKKLTNDSLIIERTTSFSNYKRPLSQVTFTKDK